MGKETVLALLLREKGHFVSGEAVSAELGITRAAIWKSISALRAQGYEIDAVTGRGYCLKSLPDTLTEQTVRSYLGPVETVGKRIDLKALEEFHRSHGKIATITAVNIGQRFGVLDLEDNGKINSFREKNDDDGSLINGGYMVLNPGVFDYIEGDSTVFEQAPLRNLAKDGELMAYRHEGFWKCMDTQREKQQLEAMWQSGNAPWKIWE